MNPCSRALFKTLADAAQHEPVTIEFNGEPLQVLPVQSLAAALLAAGIERFRATPVSGAPRAPFCMMGACFDCLVEVDGVGSRQACLVAVRPGMVVRSQEGLRALPDSDLSASHAG